ncbi:MFS general substrate transporter [Meredithblackwellia eburnea MCA 4105]
MGKYQKRLLVLCGFGWMADNMWLQCVAVILPRVQEHFRISDRWIGLLSASIFGGMMFGAWGWGSYSDSKGRRPAFHLTLLITSFFGTLSAISPSFFLLCLALFGVGTGVGGSMPTDGTLFLENIPKTHHYLLTALSAFFSLGAVLTSLLGLVIIPQFSCPEAGKGTEPPPCDVRIENRGWRYMLGALAIVSIFMSLLRSLFFRLQESPKYLVAAGRPSEAVVALDRISRINGEDRPGWELDDVRDFSSTGQDPSRGRRLSDNGEEGYGTPSPPTNGGTSSRWVDRASEEFRERIQELFVPQWALTTKLVWTIWTVVSAGYTASPHSSKLIFNVFLPKYLEQKVSGGGEPDGRAQSLRDYVIYTTCSLPGPFLGAYLIETKLGRRSTMAISTLLTSLATFVFVFVDSQSGVVGSSTVVSLAASLMYAVIYSYTPEVFPPSIRGTATGLASSFSRLAGIVAPLLTGVLLSINVSLPLFVSAGFFFVGAACMWKLPIETRGRPGGAVVGAH